FAERLAQPLEGVVAKSEYGHFEVGFDRLCAEQPFQVVLFEVIRRHRRGKFTFADEDGPGYVSVNRSREIEAAVERHLGPIARQDQLFDGDRAAIQRESLNLIVKLPAFSGRVFLRCDCGWGPDKGSCEQNREQDSAAQGESYSHVSLRSVRNETSVGRIQRYHSALAMYFRTCLMEVTQYEPSALRTGICR